MRKLGKIALWTVGGLAGLLVLALVAVRLFLPMEKIRDLAVAEATERLGRDVAVGEVGLSLRGGLGVSVRDVVVGNPEGFPGAPFLVADACDLKLRLRPLLGKRVEIDRLVVEGPRLRLVRTADGADNFTFAPTGGKGGGSTPAPAADEAAVSFDRFAVANGELVFRDDAAGTGLRLTGIDLASSMTNPGPGRFVLAGEGACDSLRVVGPQDVPPLRGRVEFTAEYDRKRSLTNLTRGAFEVNGLAGELTGTFSTADGGARAQGRLTAAELAPADLLAFLPPERRTALADVELGGRLQVAADLDWDRDRAKPLTVAGRAGLVGGRVTAPSLPEPVEDLAATVEFTLEKLRIAACEIKLPSGRLGLSGDVTGLPAAADAPAPRLDLAVEADLDLAFLAANLPAELEAVLAGHLTATARLRGAADDPAALLHEAQAKLTNLAYADARLPVPLERLSADLAWRDGVLTATGITAAFPGSDVAGRVTVRKLLPWALPPDLRGAGTPAVPVLEYDLASRRCDVDRLIPVVSPGAAPAGARARGAGGAEAGTRGMPDILGRGQVRIDTLVYSRVEFTDVTGLVEIRDRKLTCRNLAGRVYTGAATGVVEVDLTDLDEPRYAGSYRAERIEADDFLRRFTRFGGFVYGKFDLEGTYAAVGRDPARLRRSISMDSLARMREGKVVTSGFVHRGLSELASRFGGQLAPEQALRELATAIRVENGRVILDDLRTVLGDLGDLELGGSYGLDGDLDYTGTLKLSERHTRALLGGGVAGNVTRLLGAERTGRLDLPLRVDGSFAKPRFGVDTSALGKKAADDLTGKAKDKLKGLFD